MIFFKQMIKFIENEKDYYRQLNNIIISNFMPAHNNGIIISNRNLQELYKEMSNAHSNSKQLLYSLYRHKKIFTKEKRLFRPLISHDQKSL